MRNKRRPCQENPGTGEPHGYTAPWSLSTLRRNPPKPVLLRQGVGGYSQRISPGFRHRRMRQEGDVARMIHEGYDCTRGYWMARASMVNQRRISHDRCLTCDERRISFATRSRQTVMNHAGELFVGRSGSARPSERRSPLASAYRCNATRVWGPSFSWTRVR